MIPEGSCSSGTIPEYSGAGIFTYSNSHLNGSGEPPWTCGEHSLTHSESIYLLHVNALSTTHYFLFSQWRQFGTPSRIVILQKGTWKFGIEFGIWNQCFSIFNQKNTSALSCLYFHFSFSAQDPRAATDIPSVSSQLYHATPDFYI
jgi:hypothetical protein